MDEIERESPSHTNPVKEILRRLYRRAFRAGANQGRPTSDGYDHSTAYADLHAAGYRLVPVEPTDAAIERLANLLHGALDLNGHTDRRVRDAARALHRAVVEGDG